MNTSKNPLKGSALLVLGSFIWGTTFVAQSMGTNHLDAFSFNCIRNFIGVFALIPVLFVQLYTQKENMNDVQTLNLADSEIGTKSVSFAQKLKNIFTKDLWGGAPPTRAGRPGPYNRTPVVFPL